MDKNSISNTGKIKLAVYTVLTGEKEPLGNPLEFIGDERTDLDLSYICYTDDLSLKSDVWDIRYFQSEYLPAEKMSRRPKAMPHMYLHEYEWSLYIDNIVKFKRLPNSSDLEKANLRGFMIYRHSSRKSPIDEAEILVQLGYEDASVLCRQLEFYNRTAPHREGDGFGTCTVMLRRHGDDIIKNFGRIWWENILTFSKRDQISFGYSLRMSGLVIDYFDEYIHESHLVYTPANAASGRIKSNFDEKKYAWINRDMLSGMSPKAHFLSVKAKEEDYLVKSSMLDFLAFKNGSSLGNFVSPRRSVAKFLNDIFFKKRRIIGNVLAIETKTIEKLRFSEKEIAAALKMWMSFFPFMKFNSIQVDEFAQCNSTLPLYCNGQLFNGLIFFDFPGRAISRFEEKYFEVLNFSSQDGFVVLMGASPFELDELELVRIRMQNKIGRKVDCIISGMYHDDCSDFMKNCCVVYIW